MQSRQPAIKYNQFEDKGARKVLTNRFQDSSGPTGLDASLTFPSSPSAALHPQRTPPGSNDCPDLRSDRVRRQPDTYKPCANHNCRHVMILGLGSLGASWCHGWSGRAVTRYPGTVAAGRPTPAVLLGGSDRRRTGPAPVDHQTRPDARFGRLEPFEPLADEGETVDTRLAGVRVSPSPETPEEPRIQPEGSPSAEAQPPEEAAIPEAPTDWPS